LKKLHNLLNKKLLWIYIPLFIILIILIDNYQERYIPPDIITDNEHFLDKAGIIHVHTTYSDGSGTVEEIAEIAQEADADFLITADHNNWDAFYDNKEKYYNGTLVIIGMELSSPAGHLLLLPKSPSPVFKSNDSVDYDSYIKNSELLIFFAHPYHPKTPVTDWNFVPCNGLELINGDSEWRNDNIIELIEALIGSVFYRSYLNLLLDTPVKLLQTYDDFLKSEKMIIIGSTDAHAAIKISNQLTIKFPSYRDVFRMIKTHILLENDFINDIDHDKQSIIEALERGRCYIGIDGYCNTRGFGFYGIKDNEYFHMGDSISYTDNLKLFVQSPDTSAIRIKLFRNGKMVKKNEGRKLSFQVNAPGVYRVEIYQLRRKFPFLKRRERPWIFSNPIFITKEG